MRFNYRNTETGTYNYKKAFKKVERGSLGTGRMNSLTKGTMQVTDLWADPQMHEILGSPSFPRDRLKILKIWAGKGAPRPAKVGSNTRLKTLPWFNLLLDDLQNIIHMIYWSLLRPFADDLRRLSTKESLIDIGLMQMSLSLESCKNPGEYEGRQKVNSYCDWKQDNCMNRLLIEAVAIVVSKRGDADVVHVEYA